jgi:hypothetical protein
MTFLQKHAAKGQVVTGLLYVDPDREDLHAHLDTVETPLNTLEARICAPARRRWKRSTPACGSSGSNCWRRGCSGTRSAVAPHCCTRHIDGCGARSTFPCI